mgnify:CR=1 FL=1
MLNRNLELFIKVAEYGSITKVAKAFYITQPAVCLLYTSDAADEL